jgi:heme oxygenase
VLFPLRLTAFFRLLEHPMFSQNPTPGDVRQQALVALTAELITQGHPVEYAKHMATAVIFQTDLELRNAQLSRLLAWLQHKHPTVYSDALVLVEDIRQEFEHRVQQNS